MSLADIEATLLLGTNGLMAPYLSAGTLELGKSPRIKANAGHGREDLGNAWHRWAQPLVLQTATACTRLSPCSVPSPRGSHGIHGIKTSAISVELVEVGVPEI